jgi:hypothetical protein
MAEEWKEPKSIAELEHALSGLPELAAWSVTLTTLKGDIVCTVRPKRAELDLIKTLSAPTGEPGEARAWLMKALAADPDIKLVNELPASAKALLLFEIRSRAAAYKWDLAIFHQVATTLWSGRILNDAEFHWLMDAGPAGHPYWKNTESEARYKHLRDRGAFEAARPWHSA